MATGDNTLTSIDVAKRTGIIDERKCTIVDYNPDTKSVEWINYYKRHNELRSLCSKSLPMSNKLNLEYKKEADKADSIFTPKSYTKNESLGMNLLKAPNFNSSNEFTRLMDK